MGWDLNNNKQKPPPANLAISSTLLLTWQIKTESIHRSFQMLTSKFGHPRRKNNQNNFVAFLSYYLWYLEKKNNQKLTETTQD